MVDVRRDGRPRPDARRVGEGVAEDAAGHGRQRHGGETEIGRHLRTHEYGHEPRIWLVCLMR